MDLVLEQGLTRMVMPDEASLEGGTLEALRLRGVEVVIATGQAGLPRDLCAMLPRILGGS